MEKSALSSVGIKNGSWGLHSAEFETPSEMLSFAVIDYTGSSLTSKASSEVFEVGYSYHTSASH